MSKTLTSILLFLFFLCPIGSCEPFISNGLYVYPPKKKKSYPDVDIDGLKSELKRVSANIRKLKPFTKERLAPLEKCREICFQIGDNAGWVAAQKEYIATQEHLSPSGFANAPEYLNCGDRMFDRSEALLYYRRLLTLLKKYPSKNFAATIESSGMEVLAHRLIRLNDLSSAVDCLNLLINEQRDYLDSLKRMSPNLSREQIYRAYAPDRAKLQESRELLARILWSRGDYIASIGISISLTAQGLFEMIF